MRDKDGKETDKLVAAFAIQPAPDEEKADHARRRIVLLHFAILGLAAVVATLTALSTLYLNGKVFGTTSDYIGAFLWGFGTDATLRGFSSVFAALQKSSGQSAE